MPNKLSQFWQELKRRNVVRVMTVYAGAAFVILELVDIIAEPLKLPSWLLPVVIVLLSIGFIIAIIVSWIYDVHPEGGVVKTEPVDSVREEETPATSNSWKVASYISFVVIVALIVLNIIPRTGNKKVIDKSIAVLPFRNESSDNENTYFINGMMESILDNLSRVEDLRVISRNSVEKYRDDPQPTPVVAEEMDVGYVLEGSGQKLGNRLLLTLQLIVGDDDRHIWSKQYDREIEKVEDLIDIQKEVAQLVVKEIEAIITPEEKQLIEMIPTTSITAHDYFQQAQEAHRLYQYEGDSKYLVRAEEFYKEALKYDSTYAHAYMGLASIYWTKYYWKTFFSEDFLDSVLIFTDIALKYNNQLSSAYVQKADYYRETGQYEKAVQAFDDAIRFNPNDWNAYFNKGLCIFENDIFGALKNFHKAISLNRNPQQKPFMLRTLAWTYANTGFRDLSIKYYEEVNKLVRNESYRFFTMYDLEQTFGNYRKAAEWMTECYKMDSTNLTALWNLVYNNVMLEEYHTAWNLFQKYLDKLNHKENFGLFQLHRVGLIYWENGFHEKGEQYFLNQIETLQRINELGRGLGDSIRTSYDLAATYAFLGEKEKAYEYLKIYSKASKRNLYYLSLIRIDPLFNNIRNEPEFQQFARDIENNYKAEHERVKQWLEENYML